MKPPPPYRATDDCTDGPIVFVGNARDYHAMDWFRAVQQICVDRRVVFVTDLVESEGHPKLTRSQDIVIDLINIDRLLFRHQSTLGNIWRNVIKALFIPFQAFQLKRLATAEQNAFFHAHTMYYMVLCWICGLKFIATPQGSEILVRPFKSRFYRFFATKALISAEHILVDSEGMKSIIEKLSGRVADIVQFGIDSTTISNCEGADERRHRIISCRGFYPIYQIEMILEGRSNSRTQPALQFFYPFFESGYRATLVKKFRKGDVDLGRIENKTEMFGILKSTLLVISIPVSDSSPRSVYEAIFCGACVAVGYSKWIDNLPICMKDRLFIVDLCDNLWLDKAIEFALKVTANPYVASELALEKFSQERIFRRTAASFYS